MGTVVIGGLILSTLLTLLIVPAGFSLADGLEKRVGPWMRTRLLTYRPGDDRRKRRAGRHPPKAAPGASPRRMSGTRREAATQKGTPQDGLATASAPIAAQSSLA